MRQQASSRHVEVAYSRCIRDILQFAIESIQLASTDCHGPNPREWGLHQEGAQRDTGIDEETELIMQLEDQIRMAKARRRQRQQQQQQREHATGRDMPQSQCVGEPREGDKQDIEETKVEPRATISIKKRKNIGKGKGTGKGTGNAKGKGAQKGKGTDRDYDNEFGLHKGNPEGKGRGKNVDSKGGEQQANEEVISHDESLEQCESFGRLDTEPSPSRCEEAYWRLLGEGFPAHMVAGLLPDRGNGFGF